MENKMLTANEARERLEMLKDPHARLEDQMREARAYKAAFNDYWMRGIVRDTLKKETGSAGGYLVPDSFERQIMDTLGARNVLRQLCRIIQTTQDMTIPRVAGHGQAFWVPEGGTLPLSDDQFDRVTLGAYKLVIVGSPVWAGRCASPIRALLKRRGLEMENVAYVVTRSTTQRSEEVYDQMDMYTGQAHRLAVSLRPGSEGYEFWRNDFIQNVRRLLEND